MGEPKWLRLMLVVMLFRSATASDWMQMSDDHRAREAKPCMDACWKTQFCKAVATSSYNTAWPCGVFDLTWMACEAHQERLMLNM